MSVGRYQAADLLVYPNSSMKYTPLHHTVGVKCSPLLAILTGLWASAQTCLLLHSVTVTLQVNKTDGSAQVFLEGTNAMIKDKLLSGLKTNFPNSNEIY